MSSSEQVIADNVQSYGWHAISISDIDPPFVYTVGLMRTFGHPEAIIFGLEPRQAHAILSVVVKNLRAGSRYAEAGKYDSVLEENLIGVRQVHASQHERYLGYAMGFCRHIGRLGELQVVQLFWPDKDGRFPFEPNCDLDVYNSQPRLDIPLTPSELEDDVDRQDKSARR